MNTQQLRCFVCVAEYLNFTKAANELYLTVPTVTHHVQSPEEELGTKLFERTSRMVRLTESGKAFYVDAAEILTRMELSFKHVQKAEESRVTFFRIGCVSRAELPRLAAPLAALRMKYPTICPRIVIDGYFGLKKLLEDGQLDLLLVSREIADQIRGGTFHKVRCHTSYALMSPEHPLAGGNSFSIDQSRTDCLITLHPKFIPFQVSNALQKEILVYLQSNPGIRCEDDQEAITLAQAGYGIAILPGFCLPPDGLPGLTVMPVQAGKEIDYGFVYAKRTPHIKLFEAEYTAHQAP